MNNKRFFNNNSKNIKKQMNLMRNKEITITTI